MMEVLKQYQQDKLVTCVAWSSKTFMDSLPYEVVYVEQPISVPILAHKTET